eukprot:10418802-Lingulodinium_polyedra.AAC.1
MDGLSLAATDPPVAAREPACQTPADTAADADSSAGGLTGGGATGGKPVGVLGTGLWNHEGNAGG